MKDKLRQIYTRLRTFWNSPIEISVLDFRKAQLHDKDLPKPIKLNGTIVDRLDRTISRGGSCLHVNYPEGWLKFLNDKVTEDPKGLPAKIELIELQNSKYVILTTGEKPQ